MPDELSRFMAGIRAVESGGDYTVRGPVTPYGRASGAYQFIDSTWANYGGYRSAYLAPPSVQDRRARQLMSAYHREFGRWDLVAVAWHAGPDTARNVQHDPSALRGVHDQNIATAEYVRRVLAKAGLPAGPGHGHAGHGNAGHGNAGHGHAGHGPAGHHGEGGGSGHRPGRPRSGADLGDLRPWRVPPNVAGAGRRIIIDPDLLERLGRQLTDHLAVVDTAYRRCRRAADEVNHAALAGREHGPALRTALAHAFDGPHGLRALPDLLSRDIGYVVTARQRALGADAGHHRAEHTLDRLVAGLAGRHGPGTRRHVARLLHELYRPDRRHRPPTRPHRPGGAGHRLADVELGKAWGGTRSIFEQFVIPFMKARGLAAGSQKRDHDSVPGPGVSDHYVGSTHAYATDFPTFRGEDDARALARAMGNRSWQPNSYPPFEVTVDGHRFRVQILWGAAIDHADHVHVGIHRR